MSSIIFVLSHLCPTHISKEVVDTKWISKNLAEYLSWDWNLFWSSELPQRHYCLCFSAESRLTEIYHLEGRFPRSSCWETHKPATLREDLIRTFIVPNRSLHKINQLVGVAFQEVCTQPSPRIRRLPRCSHDTHKFYNLREVYDLDWYLLGAPWIFLLYSRYFIYHKVVLLCITRIYNSRSL